MVNFSNPAHGYTYRSVVSRQFLLCISSHVKKNKERSRIWIDLMQPTRKSLRYKLMKKKYADKKKAHGTPYTGLSDARRETMAIGEIVKGKIENVLFDVNEYNQFEIPG